MATVLVERQPKTWEQIQAMLKAEREARKAEITKNYPATEMKRVKKVEYYGDGSTRNAIKVFKNLLENGKFGKVVKVQGDWTQEKWYRVRFIHESGHQSVFDGFGWWYGGEGGSGLSEVLELIGVDEKTRKTLTHFDYNTHGFTQSVPNCFFLNLA